jgi:hypothetical protein
MSPFLLLLRATLVILITIVSFIGYIKIGHLLDIESLKGFRSFSLEKKLELKDKALAFGFIALGQGLLIGFSLWLFIYTVREIAARR